MTEPRTHLSRAGRLGSMARSIARHAAKDGEGRKVTLPAVACLAGEAEAGRLAYAMRPFRMGPLPVDDTAFIDHENLAVRPR